VYGFDYDYTLAQYTDDLPRTIFQLTKELLVSERKVRARPEGSWRSPVFAGSSPHTRAPFLLFRRSLLLFLLVACSLDPLCATKDEQLSICFPHV